MPARAWVIAIQDYPQMQGPLAAALPGTHQAALDFIDWLQTSKKVQPADIVFNTDGVLPGRTRGATRAELIQSLLDVAKWANRTAELYVFFSGHGFFYSDTGGRATADVLVAHEFQSADLSGGACLKLQELQVELRLAMGPGDHYYFIDACRNEIKSTDVDPLGLGVRLPKSATGSPDCYTLYSTQRGGLAALDSGFGAALVSGLKGEQHAKEWNGPEMVVRFGALSQHVKTKVGDANVDTAAFGAPVSGDILTIPPPIPPHECRITVTNADPGDTFQLVIANAKGHRIDSQSFSGVTHSFRQVPDEYYLTATHPAAQVVAIGPTPADLYDDCQFQFDKKAPAVPPPAPPSPPTPALPADQPPADQPAPPTPVAVSPASLEVVGTPMGRIDVRSIRDGQVMGSGATFNDNVPPGRYSVTLTDAGGSTVRAESVTLEPGGTLKLDLGKRKETTLHHAIVASLPADAVTPSTVDFSEGIGQILDDDLGVWLAVLGGARIVRDPQSFRKLKHLSLPAVPPTGPHQSAFYVLVGLENVDRVTVQPGPMGPSLSAVAVPGMQGLFAATFPCPTGPLILTLQISDAAPLTVVSHALPDRASLVVVTEDEAVGLGVQQFLLPLYDHKPWLDPAVSQRLPLDHEALDTVRFMALAQRRFAGGRPVEPTAGRDQGYWMNLLYDKWLDPVMAVIASYELMRRGKLASDSVAAHATLQQVVNNLRRYFPGLPDTEAIAKLAGLPHQKPPSPPMLLEGVLAFDADVSLPLPASRLEYGSPWTMWRAAPRVHALPAGLGVLVPSGAS